MHKSLHPLHLVQPLRMASCWVLLIGLAMSLSALVWLWKDARREDARRFRNLVEDWRQEFETRVEKYEQALDILADWSVNNETPSLTEWRNRMERLGPRVNYPGMARITYSPWFAESSPNVERWADNPPMHWPKPEEWRTWELPVWYQHVEPPLEPLVFGYSMGKELLPHIGQGETLLSGLVYAFHAKGVGVSGRMMIPSASAAQAQSGFMFYISSFRRDLPRSTETWEKALPPNEQGNFGASRSVQMQQTAIGMFTGTLLMEPFLKSIFGERELEIEVDVYAGIVNDTNRLTRLSVAPIQNLKNSKNSMIYDMEIPWYRNRWHIVASPNDRFYANSHRLRAWIVGIGGTLISFSMFGLLKVQERSRWKAERWARSLEAAREELREVHHSRIRLERDLHDGALQSLYASVLGIRRAVRLMGMQSETASALLGEVAEDLDAAMTDIRRHLTSSASEGISTHQLPEMIEGLAHAYNRAGEGQVHHSIDATALQHLDAHRSEQIFHCIREGVSNAQKHGSAGLIWVRIWESDRRVVLEIEDNGVGFDPLNPGHGGRGLKHMGQRAELCGGSLNIRSQTGGPTVLRIDIPIKQING